MRGMYDKYTVLKKDNKTDPEAVYFVLRIDNDEHARKAALTYAESIKEENPNLAMDLYSKVRRHSKKSDNLENEDST